ncbi:MAG: hypothetical protein BIFFINMI_00762 [Phycisphaerae bacterium]|nr:hypothetical protein [Phycisphaerae bacterium]
MKRFHQALLIATFLPLCWLGMEAAHELGHAGTAWATGGRVQRVVLQPLAFSRTDVSPNPQPLAVCWAGAIVGSLLPLILWAAGARLPGAFMLRFFAGFCLTANGAYLGAGALAGVADAGDLLRLGASRWQLVAFGAAAVAGGLTLWNGLGPRFGIGKRPQHVHPAAAWTSAALLAIVAIVEALLG